MLSLRQLVCFVLSLLSFISVFYSVAKLGIFLATPGRTQKNAETFPTTRGELRALLFPLFFNTIWVVLFVLQHSVMRTEPVKRFWKAIGLELAERSLYNIASSYCLMLLLKNWHSPSPSQYRLWFFDVETNQTLWWVLVGAHVLSWIVVYGGSLMVDLPELIGLKHVYYDINDLAPPMSYKSHALQDYYTRYRHPSFVALSVVLWFTNAMTVERLLLAIVWSVYMYLAWNTTKADLKYQRYQLERKRTELAGVTK